MMTSDTNERDLARALIPIEQDSVIFYDRPIIAVRLEDGRILVPLRWICESLKLDAHAQMRRIRRTKAISGELEVAMIQTEHGPQPLYALTLRALPFWLAGIDTSRVVPDMEPVILAYQREVVDVLYRHFAERKPQHLEARTLVPSEPIAQPTAPDRNAPAAAWLAYHEQMVQWLRWQQDVEQWRSSIESRLESVEEVSRLVPEILERLGPQKLTAEHQHTVQAGVNRLSELTGRPHAALYNDLREAFHVGTYKDIPEARWEEVVVWFRARLARAAGNVSGGKPERESLFPAE